MGKFRYKITSPVADEAYIDAPDGWKDSESIFPRSDTYKGIFRKFAANDLTLKTNGAAKLREINAVNNFESEAEFTQEEKDFETYDWFQRFKGKFDFVKYESTDGNEGRSVKINVIDSGFWNTIKNRENVKPQLNQLTSLDGFLISGFTNEEQWVTLPAVPDRLNGFSSTIDNSPPVQTDSHSVPAIAANSNDTNIINVLDSSVIDGISGAFYTVVNTVVELYLSFNINTSYAISSSGPSAILELKIKRYNSSDVLVSEDVLISVNGGDGTVRNITYSGQDLFNPNIGDYFLLTVENEVVGTSFSNVPPYISQTFIRATIDELEEVQISGMKIHELLSRNLQIISGVDIPLYSEILGDTTSEPRSYAADGALSNLLVTSGERVRGFTREESPLTLGFKETFESLYALSPICAVIENIGGIDNLRIEGIKYAFDDRIILTIDDASNVTESYLSDRIFSRILVGFQKAEYEEKDGLFEYNQKSEFSTPISVTSTAYNIVSKIGADTNSINNARAKSKSEFPTEDTRYDNNNFFITLIKNDSALLNGNFESWTDDNTPDDWAVGGTVQRKELLSSNRCWFYDGALNQASISQSVVLANTDGLNIKLSYENIGSPNTSATTASANFTAKLTDGAQTFYLQSDGSWLETASQQFIYFALSIPEIPENQLQSFKSFSLLTDDLPITGTIEFKIFAAIGIIVDDVYFGDPQYIAKTDEGYTSVQNAIFGDTSLNLDISPKRNLLAHGSIIRACGENKLSQYLKFNTSDKNSTLITQKDTESEPVAENTDVQLIDLDEPFFKPNQIDFNMKFDKSVIDVLNETFAGETKPKYLGMVRFRQNINQDYRYIWLLNPNTGGESQLGKMSGIEVNTDYVTPIEI